MRRNLHALAEERSLAYHSEVARLLLTDDSTLEAARARVESWWARKTVQPYYVEAWQRILAQSAAEVAQFIVGRSELAVELRQVSPFAGSIDPRTRWRLHREMRARWSRE